MSNYAESQIKSRILIDNNIEKIVLKDGIIIYDFTEEGKKLIKKEFYKEEN
jgi:hypothetical protein